MPGLKTFTEHDHQVAEETAREHETLIRAAGALERALAAPEAGDERSWMERTRRELANVVGFLQEHCESAEREGGLVAEAQRKLGQSVSVKLTRREHDRLSREAVALLAALDRYPGGPPLSYLDVRRRASALTARLRRHQAREADLLYEAFQRDIGGGD